MGLPHSLFLSPLSLTIYELDLVVNLWDFQWVLIVLLLLQNWFCFYERDFMLSISENDNDKADAKWKEIVHTIQMLHFDKCRL